MDDDAIREWVVKTRAKQGLPPTVQDPVVLERIAAIFRTVPKEKAAQRRAAKNRPSLCPSPTSATEL